MILYGYIFSPFKLLAPAHDTLLAALGENINKMCFEAVNESGMNTFSAAVNSTVDG